MNLWPRGICDEGIYDLALDVCRAFLAQGCRIVSHGADGVINDGSGMGHVDFHLSSLVQ